jgi:hypothetical protein
LNWTSGIELALRVISVALALSIMGTDQLGPVERDALLRFFVAHVDWMKRFPSAHSSANNHRIAELAGLIVALRMVPGIPSAADASEESWEELLREIDRQIYLDGVGAEQSTGYAAFSIELFLVAAAALERDHSFVEQSPPRRSTNQAT